ncbi:5-formyltetrahydrofolate cyclo-ligase [Thiomicrorhabdus immobilis]|uniref:5-formyltetrahydrofolate cyclo-ligase n=1 Tax=Thiomicrorhabdus immobilis TaxID=2791037 RepID=A0ABN6CX32_9GAMM|nr:5-formyltetrahydrofolate cyclo-ligase [Thiomicrorhabdus immobilis]BCN93641.1 5-formyltetrahydrofolate cyclo-ligase [Thiomicrorhabdus immobilis]
MTPSEIRKHLRVQRNNLSNSDQTLHAKQAFNHFKQLLQTETAFQTPQKIALFLSQDGELSTQETIEYLWQKTHHQVYLPVLETRDEWHMAFVHYTAQSTMIKNQFGILEPAAPHEDHLSGEKIDWVFMPLVGFDLKGNRLGMGGGYYDRTFAFKLNNPIETTKLIGWAHQCQQVENLPAEDWDVPLDGILTEQGYREF